jgi:hypothetical protein
VRQRFGSREVEKGKLAERENRQAQSASASKLVHAPLEQAELPCLLGGNAAVVEASIHSFTASYVLTSQIHQIYAPVWRNKNSV